MGLETALIGAGIGAAGNIVGSIFGGNAQKEATERAIAEQRAARGEATNLLMPFIQSGQAIMPTLQNFIDPNASGGGLNMLMRMIQPGADQSALLEQTPGYQFSLGQGLRAVNNQLAARGHGASPGAVAKGAANYATGLASTTWKDIVDRMQSAFTSGAGAMQNYANIGANAGNQLAGGILNSGNAIANNMTGLGNAQAGMFGSIGNSLAGFGNNASQYAMMQSLMGGGGGGGSIYGSGSGTGYSVNPWSSSGVFGSGGAGWAPSWGA